jgi:predicted acyl esterase
MSLLLDTTLSPAAQSQTIETKSSVALGMRIDTDVAIPMRDGLELRANVFRPLDDAKYPVIVTISPYGKDIHSQDFYPAGWDELLRDVPSLRDAGSSCRYMNFETPDPEHWVRAGYIVIRIDSRGSGKSPGYLDPWSLIETHDYYEAIEWAGTQSWSNGRVGALGISYYAINQWQVAALQPPHLAAIVPWEGFYDLYRDMSHHGGIFSNAFYTIWLKNIYRNQHGNRAGFIDRETGTLANGPVVADDLLAGSRSDYAAEAAKHPFDDQWMRERTPDLSRVQVPLLSAGNWGGMGLHLRGNIEAFLDAGSHEKWLTIHTGTHFQSFYEPRWIEVQQRFLDRYLKGEQNGWENTPPVQITVRRPDGESLRYEKEWPLARTEWTHYYLASEGQQLLSRPPEGGQTSYQALSDGVDFSVTFDKATEITGPIAARLFVSSSTSDMDVFVTLRAFAPDGKEITFHGANDPAAPLAQGWLRASHRRLDTSKSLPYRPWHTHDTAEPLTPGEVYPLDVEIWPTNFVFPPDYRLELRVQGKDFERKEVKSGMSGSGLFLHTDRAEEFGGQNTIYTGGQSASYLLLPIIP